LPDAVADSIPDEHDEEFPLPPVTLGDETRRTDRRLVAPPQSPDSPVDNFTDP